MIDRARASIPGGVSSPARAFGAVGGDPLFADRGDGAHLHATDGRRYLDYIQGFGAVILGHAHPEVTRAVVDAAGAGGAVGLSTSLEIELAELVCERVDSIERVRFVTSGTEASMTAARVARGATGRAKIVKFEGCYHGHADAFLAKAGSGVATFSVPEGVPSAGVGDTIVLPFNDPGPLEEAFREHGTDIAAVFVEPVAANMGVVTGEGSFLEAIVEGCRRHGAVSVFDEVVTGFRLGPGGAQAELGLTPDLTMLGKVLGGGLPVGAVGGRADLMELLAPTGPVYQAGTYAAHPHAMAAGVAVLRHLEDEHYERLRETTARLAGAIASPAKEAGASVARAPTFLSVSFTASPPRDFAEAQGCDRDAFSRFHQALRSEGVLIPPSPFEVWFPSLAHTDENLDATVAAVGRALASSIR